MLFGPLILDTRKAAGVKVDENPEPHAVGKAVRCVACAWVQRRAAKGLRSGFRRASTLGISGANWVARGLIEWLTSADKDAIWLRRHAEVFVAPIMDVDNVATGDGGKEENPRDQNRDWNESPVYPEVAAAQKRLLAFAEAGRLALFVDLHNPAPGDMRPFFFNGSPDVLGKLTLQNQATSWSWPPRRSTGRSPSNRRRV
jgi:murein tripeptide amidase MpaA